jgi:hypothetical protein
MHAAAGFVLVPRQQAARVASEAPDAAPAPAAPRDPVAPLPGADPRIEVVEDEDDDMMPDLEDTGGTLSCLQSALRVSSRLACFRHG